MKSILKSFFVVILMLNCTSDDDTINTCGVDNPAQDLEWLRNEIAQRNQNITEDSKYCYISQSTYNNQTIFIYGDCNPLIDKVIPVFNCLGESIGIIGGREQDIPSEALSSGRIIWKTDDFVCSF